MILEDEDPCLDCANKVDDVWGRVCDISCGKHSTHIVRQEAYKAQAEKFIEWGDEICETHYGSYLFIRRRQCEKCWQEVRG